MRTTQRDGEKRATLEEHTDPLGVKLGALVEKKLLKSTKSRHFMCFVLQVAGGGLEGSDELVYLAFLGAVRLGVVIKTI